MAAPACSKWAVRQHVREHRKAEPDAHHGEVQGDRMVHCQCHSRRSEPNLQTGGVLASCWLGLRGLSGSAFEPERFGAHFCSLAGIAMDNMELMRAGSLSMSRSNFWARTTQCACVMGIIQASQEDLEKCEDIEDAWSASRKMWCPTSPKRRCKISNHWVVPLRSPKGKKRSGQIPPDVRGRFSWAFNAEEKTHRGQPERQHWLLAGIRC